MPQEVLNSYSNFQSSPVFLSSSDLGGRGLFASTDLPEHSVVFKEPPLVLGPRADARCKTVCVKCHRVRKLKLCPSGCGLPVCEEDCGGTCHSECEVFGKLQDANLGMKERMAMVASVRSVRLSPQQRNLLNLLEGHERVEHEIRVLDHFKEVLPEEEVSVVRKCCQVFDATGYESPCDGSSLRGIYPMAALMNHCCSPNTRHTFDSEGRMVLQTTRFIKEGQELTATYTSLTWGTQARRTHLQVTKRFICACERCNDPSEFGTQLMSLYCMRKGCTGVLLPGDGTPRPDVWKCTACFKKIPSIRIDVIQNMIGATMSKVDSSKPSEACRILCNKSLVPGSNYLAVEFKLSLIRLYGHQPGFMNEDLSEEDIQLKLLLCVEVLNILSLLRLGSCRERGNLLVELQETLFEVKRRHGEAMDTSKLNLPYEGDFRKIYENARLILNYDKSSEKILQRIANRLVS